MKKAKKHLFNLPDGSSLKYAYPFERGSIPDWFRTYDSDAVWKAAVKPKGQQCRINLWSSSTRLVVIAADFDRLPETFCDYDSLYNYLSSIFSELEAIKARSASSKVKLFFLIEMPYGIEIEKAIAIETLAKIFSFNPDLFNSLDLSSTALRISYLNYDVLKALVDALPFLRPTPCVLPEPLEVFNTSTTNRDTSVRPLREYAGPIDRYMPGYKGKGVSERFLRILLESKQLLMPNGFAISTLKISQQLNVSQQLISRLRTKYRNCGWLQLLGNGFYKPGKTAMRFRASGDLELALKKLYQNRYFEVEVPDAIPDGEWNSQLGRIIGHLHHNHTLDETLAKVKKIKGANFGTRLRQAEAWYHWYVRKSSVRFSKNNMDHQAACGGIK